MMVSLVVPTYNKLPRLKLTLASLVNQTYDKNHYEVIVVNDGSTDETKDYLEQTAFPYSLRAITIPNSGRSIARNHAIMESKGEILIFVDDDVILSPQFIEMHVKNQEALGMCVHGKIIDLIALTYFKDPTHGILYKEQANRKNGTILQSRCISEYDVIHSYVQKISKNTYLSFMEKVIQSVLEGGHPKLCWIGMTGANFSCKKEWVMEAGLFDQEMGRRWGCEDFELGYRLSGKYGFYYSHECVNYHISHVRGQIKEDLKKSFEYFYHKHNDTDILKVYHCLEQNDPGYLQ